MFRQHFRGHGLRVLGNKCDAPGGRVRLSPIRREAGLTRDAPIGPISPLVIISDVLSPAWATRVPEAAMPPWAFPLFGWL